MATRLKRHEEGALHIAKWLQKRPEVAAVLHPALPKHPGHDVFKRDFSGSTGLFSFILDKKYNYKHVCNMLNHYDIFGIGASWGGFESLVMHFDLSNIRTVNKWKDAGQCIRLYIGLENVDDLIKDLEKGFARL